MSPRRSIGCLQYYFWAYYTFDSNRAPILHQKLHYLQTDWTELPLEPRHLGVPSSVSKTISMPMVCSVQTVHQSCTDINTISKWTKTRFHTTHVTYEFHQVRPKQFMSIWNVQCKLCTYLASWLSLSPNEQNRAPPNPRHLGVHPVCLKWFMSLWYVSHKQSMYLALTLKLSQNRLKRDSTRATSPRISIGCL
jgi:hypothetical protein